jgi:hypothetical protein
MSDQTETVVTNIILDNNSIVPANNISAINELDENYVLFSALKADALPIKPHGITVDYIEHFQSYSPKCAICNSPHRNLFEQVFLESGKVMNRVVLFFKEFYNARLNFTQVKQHLTKHCDFSKIETSGLMSYVKRNDLLDIWKYREYELALTAMLDELDEIRGTPARTLDEKIKRSTMIEKLTRNIVAIKEKRDDSTNSLPNVFEVLYDLHEIIKDDDSKRIIREKAKDLKEKLSA